MEAESPSDEPRFSSTIDLSDSWSDYAIPNPLYTEDAFSRPTSIRTESQKGSASGSGTKKRRNPNDARQKPANPQILSSMIDALGGLTPPAKHENSPYSDTQNGDSTSSIHERRLLRSTSMHAGSSFSATSRAGYGYEFYDQETTLEALGRLQDDHADFPVIRTARRPSHKTQRSLDSVAMSSAYKRNASVRSRSSLSVQTFGDQTNRYSSGDTYGSRSIYSPSTYDESQIGTAIPFEGAPTSMAPSTRTVRQHGGNVPNRTQSKSKALESFVIVKPYVPSTSYNSIAREDSSSLTALPGVPNVLSLDAQVSENSGINGDKHKVRSLSTSPSKNSIADAIPLRTSSLNQAEGQLYEKKHRSKKDRAKRDKGKKKKLALSEDVLEELGEGDETVRRIRELKQQREARLQRLSSANGPMDTVGTLQTQQLEYQSAARNQSIHSEETIETPISAIDNNPTSITSSKFSKNRRPSMDDAKARKVLGLNGVPDGGTGHLAEQERKRPKNLNLEGLGFFPGDEDRNAVQGKPLPADNEAAAANIKTLDTSDHRPRPLATVSSQSQGMDSRRSYSYSGNDTTAASSSLPPTRRLGRRLSRSGHSIRKSISITRAESSDRSRSIGVRQSEDNEKRQTQIWNDAFANEVVAQRRRSVDNAVDDFLRKQRLNQTVRHPKTGRKIAFSEVGDPNGAVVFVCVGMGLTRFVSTFYDELASTLKLRLITPDRPGVGGSEPYPERERPGPGPLTWHQDIVAICNQLNISEFSLLAHSAGAIYALATALVLPHYVHGKVHLLAPWIPPSQFQYYSNRFGNDAVPVGTLPRSQRFLRVLPTSMFKMANGNFLGFNNDTGSPNTARRTSPNKGRSPSKDGNSNDATNDPAEMARKQSLVGMDQLVSPRSGGFGFPMPFARPDSKATIRTSEDEAVRVSATATPTEDDFSYAMSGLNAAQHNEREKQSGYNAALTDRTWELATRNSNPALDLLVCLERNRDIGFRYMDVQRKIVITHGSDDKRVPVENVNWIAEQINRRTPAMVEPGHDFDDIYQKAGCDVRILPGEGHGLMASPIVMADVLSEIAQEARKRKSSVGR